MKQVGVTGSRLSGREVNNREETLTDGLEKKNKTRFPIAGVCPAAGPAAPADAARKKEKPPRNVVEKTIGDER